MLYWICVIGWMSNEKCVVALK